MSLSLHSSRDALTSSKRGLEKDSDIEPLKSSIGEISSRISARPPTASACSSGGGGARHSGLPMSQSNEAVCRASRSGTSSGSEIFANETRSGAPGIFCWSASPGGGGGGGGAGGGGGGGGGGCGGGRGAPVRGRPGGPGTSPGHPW